MKTQFKLTILIAFFLFSIKGLIAQEELNNYKYVVVAEQFSCQKIANSYRLNELTQFLLKKQNFKAFLTSEAIPEDLSKNNCLAVFADVVQEKNMFKTKLKVVFKDCRNKVIFTSQLGESRLKEFKSSYTEALRNAFKSFNFYNHNYKANIQLEEVKEEVIPTPSIETKPALQPKAEVAEVTPSPKQEIIKPKPTVIDIKQNTLKAELIPGSVFSYKLKNVKSETVYTILYSGKEDLYMVKGQDALIYKMNNIWVIAEHKGQDLKVKTLDIQF